ncbi:hypothetical protein HNQ36_003456 [Afipia massiliensis]|uniref:Sel1 repeat family protein n=1 Tax=Afipia massiliensis TaxID=211460 RepID=A0A840MZT8_9BRAD|nr:hypothetical protein [Afipia massiliensis]MBB5053465.1 hypothetical protein [Afipia massiliensis]
MLYSRTLLMAFCLAAALSDNAFARTPTAPVQYLKRQARIILAEGDRIKGEAMRMRSESARLKLEANGLRAAASQLDQAWERAHSIAANKYPAYPERDRSQKIMRSDADREDVDAIGLLHEGKRLDDEAMRLWNLAAAVDPQASNELLKRMQACCQKSGIEFLKGEIIRLARQFGAHYSPVP